MIDHIGVPVSDMARSKRFYEQSLAPLGYVTVMDFGEAAGLGAGGKPDLWIAKSTPGPSLHVAILSDTRAGVDAFYKAAIAAGDKDNGAPGLRPQYHPNYYGAFVFDPDGHNLEAVCHKPE